MDINQILLEAGSKFGSNHRDRDIFIRGANAVLKQLALPTIHFAPDDRLNVKQLIETIVSNPILTEDYKKFLLDGKGHEDLRMGMECFPSGPTPDQSWNCRCATPLDLVNANIYGGVTPAPAPVTEIKLVRAMELTCIWLSSLNNEVRNQLMQRICRDIRDPGSSTSNTNKVLLNFQLRLAHDLKGGGIRISGTRYQMRELLSLLIFAQENVLNDYEKLNLSQLTHILHA